MGHRHLVSTPAAATTCRKCRRIVLAGWSDGFMVRTDPQPLNALGELAALVAGKRTYNVSAVTRLLWLRDTYNIGRRDHQVLADHICGAAQPPPEYRAPPTAVQARSYDTDVPPF
jgi:hypothetical protein